MTCAVERAVIARLRFVSQAISLLTAGVPACYTAEGARFARCAWPFKPSAGNLRLVQPAPYGSKVRITAFHDHRATSLHLLVSCSE
jgi:hypothetical protein